MLSRSSSCIGSAIRTQSSRPALGWLDERLAKQDTTADSAVREVHRSQGAANVTVRNIVTSLRVIVEVDWKELFERYCLVDGALAKGGAFSQMDFATRTLYRSAVEELARGSIYDELAVARLAVASADAPHPSMPALEQSRRADSGYYLLAGGRREFEASIGFRRFPFLPARATATLNFGAYAGSIVATSLVLLTAPIFALAKMGVGAFELTLLALVGAISAIDVAAKKASAPAATSTSAARPTTPRQAPSRPRQRPLTWPRQRGPASGSD